MCNGIGSGDGGDGGGMRRNDISISLCLVFDKDIRT